jgi:glycosyltransferase involved in cell wall biosynthesis
MKILRIIPFLDFGGVEQRVKLTALGFQDVPDVDLIIVVLGHGGRVSEELVQMGIMPLILNSGVRIPNIKLIYSLYRIMKEHRPDVVHCSGSEANFHGLIATKMAGVKVKIGEEIGFPNHQLAWRFIFKVIYSLADGVIAISHAVADKIVELGEVPADKISVVYNPVAFPVKLGKQLASRNSDQFVFVTICRLVPVKNLDTLLKAFQQLVLQAGADRLRLHIVGDGSEMEGLMKLSEELSIGGAVKFLGFQKDVTSFLQEADAFVLPSFSEGFSIALVEAMLCGLPAIVTKIGGPAEIVKEGQTGFLIDPYSEEELRMGMWKVYSMSETERKLIGSLAQQDARRFSTENYVNELVTIYQQ